MLHMLSMWCSMVHMARNLQNMCLVIILLAACSVLGATVSTASSAPDFVFVPTSGPCLTNNGGQPTVPYYNDIVVSKAVSRDPEPGETHIPGHGPEVETIEACLAACLERNVHVVSVNFLQGRECMCSGGCPCFEPLGGGWLVALPANCQHQQPQVCQDSESNGGWEPRGNRSSCMGFFDKGGHPVDDTKMSHPWGKAFFAHCHQPFSWRQMNKNMSKDVFKTGGLGTLMEMDGYETWVCLHSSIIRPHWNPRCPHTGLVATVDPWFCWVYHETREEFTPWGPNSRVKLFDPPPVKDPIRSPDGRFVLVDMPMTWEEARTYCRTHFADLVSIHSSLVNSIVASLCEKAASVNGAEHGDTGIACWIGGYRSMSSQGLDLWAWSDGSVFDFTSWSEGEPNNMGSHGEPYIHMWRGGERVGTWNDNGAGFEAGATVCSAVVEVAGSGYSYWDFDPVDGCVTESEMNARKALEDLDTQEWWPDFASMAGFAHAGGAADKCGGISEEDFKAFAAKYFSGGSGGECSLCADPTHNCRCSAEKGLSGVCGPAPFCYDAATTAMGGRTAQEQCVADSDIWCGSHQLREVYYDVNTTGWCRSDLDEHLGNFSSAQECWAACKAKHGEALVAVDWWVELPWIEEGSTECYCQDDCTCMSDVGMGEGQLVTAGHIVLPRLCGQHPSGCGDGIRIEEACDDGNLYSGDGCSSACTVECGWRCAGGSATTADACTTTCGDGVVAAGVEGCDDGNTVDGDGCSSTCTVESTHKCTSPTCGISTCRMTTIATKCSFTVDDVVDKVYYNGAEITHTVQGDKSSASDKKTLRFNHVQGGVLAMAGHDRNSGHSAGMWLKCEQWMTRSASAISFERVGVWDGQMAQGDSVQIEGPDFVSANSFLSAGGINKFLNWTLDIGTDDFDISSSFKADLVEGTALCFVLWVGDTQYRVGLDGHGQLPFREGGAWGSTQTDSGLSTTPLKANTLHTLRLMRTAGALTVFFDGSFVPGWQSLSFSYNVTTIGWRPWRNTVHVQSLVCLQQNQGGPGSDAVAPSLLERDVPEEGVPVDSPVLPDAYSALKEELLGSYVEAGAHNDWHYVNVTFGPKGLRWKNRAGVHWSLTLTSPKYLAVGPDCPYFDWPSTEVGHTQCEIVRDQAGAVVALLGPGGNRYIRSSGAQSLQVHVEPASSNCKVFAADSASSAPPSDWTQNIFNDSDWKEPETNGLWSGCSSSDDYCWGSTWLKPLAKYGVWNERKKYNFWRITLDAPKPPMVLVDVPMTWTEAQRYCRTHFIDLVSVHSSQANDLVVSLCAQSTSASGDNERDSACWIGGLWVEHPEIGSWWSWSDGSAFSFENWNTGEPNGGGQGEPYINIWKDPSRWGKWNDYSRVFKAGATICRASLDHA